MILVDRIESPGQHLRVADTRMDVLGRSWVDAFQSGRASVSADGRSGLETGVWPVPIAAVEPGRKMRGALGGGVVEVGVGPLAQGGLDEAFGFAVGAGREGARVAATEAGLRTGP